MLKIIGFLILLSVSLVECWEALPQIPTGRRSQYLVLHENGGYKYGYDTGDGSAAQQSGDPSNQVEGRYFYNTPSGQQVNLKYTAGVQGFVPEDSPSIPSTATTSLSTQYSHNQPNYVDEGNTGDNSYSFSIDTDTYKRQESSEDRGNVKGWYSYNNEAGTHDLSFTAGENIGFVATSGSLSTPNGLKSNSVSRGYSNNPSTADKSVNQLPPLSASNILNADGSYSFSYSSPQATHQQSGDINGNVKGSFSYTNPTGTHDLSYIAGSDTGFITTGGSLSQPNGLRAQTGFPLQNSPTSSSSKGSSNTSTSYISPVDGSYRFEYSNEDSSRREMGDANGNVQGSYSFRNQGQNYDLSYVAGSSTGFQVTGGSLSVPNGLKESHPNIVTPTFSNVPTGITPIKSYSSVEQNDLENTGDASYSFTIDTDNYKRTETSDASGNVQGRFSYNDNAGIHDLSFVAGSGIGFQPTGGSLFNPSTISKVSPVSPSTTVSNSEQGVGDASYSFSIDTDDYKRTESSDASGNVIGKFLYKNSVGQHDLSYEAGAERGFSTTGGSLSIPPGLTGVQLKFRGYSSQIPFDRTSPVVSPVLPTGRNSYSIGNVVVNSYLPPNNEKSKFGYIFYTKY